MILPPPYVDEAVGVVAGGLIGSGLFVQDRSDLVGQPASPGERPEDSRAFIDDGRDGVRQLFQVVFTSWERCISSIRLVIGNFHTSSAMSPKHSTTLSILSCRSVGVSYKDVISTLSLGVGTCVPLGVLLRLGNLLSPGVFLISSWRTAAGGSTTVPSVVAVLVLDVVGGFAQLPGTAPVEAGNLANLESPPLP
ncbi:MAG: hypothetical protein K2X52_15950 [Mycobacteriaceae bacterium]|nr:hypothetical protein [Mycobacteriaceae bacterium]